MDKLADISSFESLSNGFLGVQNDLGTGLANTGRMLAKPATGIQRGFQVPRGMSSDGQPDTAAGDVLYGRRFWDPGMQMSTVRRGVQSLDGFLTILKKELRAGKRNMNTVYEVYMAAKALYERALTAYETKQGNTGPFPRLERGIYHNPLP